METKIAILTDMEKILEAAEDSELNDGFFQAVAKPLEILSKRLGVNKVQAALFAIITDKSYYGPCSEEQIAGYLNFKNINMINLYPDLEVLKKLRLIKLSTSCYKSEVEYSVPKEVLTSLLNGQKIEIPNDENLDFESLTIRLDNLFDERRDDHLPYLNFVGEIKELLKKNKDIEFANQLIKSKLHDTDLIILIRFCLSYIFEQENTICSSNFEDLLISKSTTKDSIRKLNNGTHPLILDKWVEFEGSGLFGGNSFKLTDRAKKLLFPKNYYTEKILDLDELQSPESIAAKTLFYTKDNSIQIESLQKLLLPDSFRNVRQRMKAKNMRNGFACLFFGEPGTGKTETVLQIARATGRHIMQVNLAEKRNMWVGESEKRVKAVFDKYRNFVELCHNEPFLFFNEADGIIGRRSSHTVDAVNKMENTLQNIILQEMENLDGIMIATTNFTQSMDPAFERRFLYKINFQKPDDGIRQRIWHSMMPELSEDQIAFLTKRFAFSGGQIENIARKSTVESLLSGATPEFDTIIRFCQEESLHKDRPAIGY